MTVQIVRGYPSSTTPKRNKAEGQLCIEQIIAITKEMIGGNAEKATTNLASDSLTIVDDYCIYPTETQTGTSDDLSFILCGGTIRDGFVVGIRPASSNIINIKHATTGAKKIFTRNGKDIRLASTQHYFWAKFNTAADAWYEINPDLSFILNMLLGTKAISTLTISSNAVAGDRALHLISSAGADHLDFITGNDYLDGNIIGIKAVDMAQVRTLKHNITGTGKLNNLSAADIIMAANTWYFYIKNGTQWDQLYSANNVLVKASTAAGKLAIADGTTGNYRETGGTLAKGKIPVGSDANDFGYLATDTDGKVLTLDSTQTLGVKWATPSAGGSLYGDGADGAKTISTNTTETVPKDFRLTTLTIQTGCTWTVKSGTLIMCTGAVDIQGTGKLVVSADIPGGTAGNASGLIRQNGSGPSPGTCSAHGIYSVPSGGGCGGPGGDGGFIAAGSMPGGKGGAAIAPAPGVTGSGGGAGYYGGNPAICGNGGNGGGSVGLYSGSTINIAASAKITANGTDGSAQSTTYGVAGAGGSGGVIDIGALISITNSGTIEAKGGLGGNAVNSGYFAPGGGGGLVNLTAPSITAGTITLTGGAKGSGGTAHDVSPTNGSTGVTYSTSAAPVKYRCF